MRAARLASSDRLQRTLDVLLGAGSHGLTTMELIVATGSVAPHSDVAELRANGLRIRCALDRTTAAGRRVYRYRLDDPYRELAGLEVGGV